jgi:hypothetical protein
VVTGDKRGTSSYKITTRRWKEVVMRNKLLTAAIALMIATPSVLAVETSATTGQNPPSVLAGSQDTTLRLLSTAEMDSVVSGHDVTVTCPGAICTGGGGGGGGTGGGSTGNGGNGGNGGNVVVH